MHTVTPFRVDRDTYSVDIRDAQDNLVAVINKDFDHAEANAALIVQAVNAHGKLIEVVKSLLQEVDADTSLASDAAIALLAELERKG
jgi:hypothetical protein